MTDTDPERAAKHQAAYDRIAATIDEATMTALIAARDQLDTLTAEIVEDAGGILHHMYLGEDAHADAHAALMRRKLTDMEHAQLVDLVGRLASMTAQRRYRFTGLGEQ